MERIPPGPRREGDVIRFRVFAPGRRRVDLVFHHRDPSHYGRDGRDRDRGAVIATLPMTPDKRGWFEVAFEGPPRLLYKFRLDDDGAFPDPASRSQPFGVHGPSEVTADWPADRRASPLRFRFGGVALEELVIYETHVGAATAEGTFDALAGRLEHVRALGATAIELMPVASFPGRRNWGYDTGALFAPHAAYGGPSGLRRLIDAAHRLQLAVILDVVYNHLGPDGNYLPLFYRDLFTKRRKTPWGDAIDFSQPAVRELFIANAEMWIRDYGADGLRLDATHAIFDDSRPHVLQEIAEAARAAGEGRRILVIAEDDRNERRLVLPPSQDGHGLDAVWADDFHHEVRRAIAGDRDGYFMDYSGSARAVAATVERGWLYQGQESLHWKRPRGTPAAGLAPRRFVHFIQNHDQIGNRAFGDRLGQRCSPAAYRAAGALVLLSPHTPLLFMGQEWNASTPFLYFTDHEEALGRAVREGRRKEFASFSAFAGQASPPDPQSSTTFEHSRLRWDELGLPAHARMLAYHRELLLLRRRHPALRLQARERFAASAAGDHGLAIDFRGAPTELLLLVSLEGELRYSLPAGNWRVLLSSEESRFGGDDHAGVSEGLARLDGPGALVLERLPRG